MLMIISDVKDTCEEKKKIIILSKKFDFFFLFLKSGVDYITYKIRLWKITPVDYGYKHDFQISKKFNIMCIACCK